jgi:hypothetical protein
VAVAVVAVVVAGCSSSHSPSVVRTPTTSTPAPSTSAPVPSTSAPVPSTSAPSGSKAAQTVTISPSTGLKSGQVVQVSANGFSPNEALVINECADKGANTGPGDCNLQGLVPTMSDAKGSVSAQYTVTAGPFGASNIVCSATQPCLLSVSQATPSPTEEADVRLQFG